MSVRDTRLLARALMERWPIKPEYRAAIIQKLMQVVANPNTKEREMTAAAKALLAADKQNLEAEKWEHERAKDRRISDLSQLAQRLGLGEDAIEAIESGGVWVADPASQGRIDERQEDDARNGSRAEAGDTDEGGRDNDSQMQEPE